MNAAKMRAWLSIVELNDKQFEQRKEIESMKGKLAADKVFIELLNAKLDEKNAEIKELKIRAREADEAEKAANVLIEKHNDMAYRLNKAEAENVRKDYEIENLKKANAKMADEKEEETLSFFEKNSYLQTSLDIAREKLRIAGNEFVSMKNQIEALQKAAASPMFEDSDGLPMDVDEMAYRLKVSSQFLDEKNAEIIRLKAQLYDYQNPHDD